MAFWKPKRKRTRKRRKSKKNSSLPFWLWPMVPVGAFLAVVPESYWRYFPTGIALVAALFIGLALFRVRQHRVTRERQKELDRQVGATDGMTGPEFEQLVARLLVRDGYSEVKREGGAGDLGADVTAIDPEDRKVVIQCKRYGKDNSVGSADMQRFMGTVFQVHAAEVAMFVTTSRFTSAATELASSHNIALVDRIRLAEWMSGEAPIRLAEAVV